MARPRSIPENEALERALTLFWENGYDRTSIADLSESIGVGPSSIYNAFGNKLEIYRKSINLYMQTHASFAAQVFAIGSDQPANESILALLTSAVRLYTDKDTPMGCAIFQSAGAGNSQSSQACEITNEIKQNLERALYTMLQTRSKAGDQLSNSPKVLSKFILATMRGISQLASDGTNQSDLLKIASHAAASCQLNTTSLHHK
ncbi:MAG: TetR/AcrR family transcriptional regulator [Phycisphaerales bacterium]